MRRFLPILIFAAVTLAAFWKVLLDGRYTLLVGGDMLVAYYPWFDVASHWLREGILLLWDPHVYAGKLNMGEPQPGMYYPLNWLVMLIPGFDGVNPAGLQGLLVLNYFLAGLFFYLLGRDQGLSIAGASVAGFGWAFGGFTVQLYGYVNVLSGFVWFPLVVLFFRRSCTAGRWEARARWATLAGLFLALSFLAGHHVPPVHTGLFLLLYSVFVTYRAWKSSTWKQRAAPMLLLGLVAATSLLLTAFQWLPSLEWAQRVHRWVGEGPPLVWGESVPYSSLERSENVVPQDAFSLVFPHLSERANLYVGLPLLFLALVGVLYSRAREARFHAVAAFFYFLVAWGAASVLHGWLNTFVPGMWFAREVFYYLVPLQACLSLLAGWGLDRVVESWGRDPDEGLRMFVRRAVAGIAVLFLLSVAFLTALRVTVPMSHWYAQAIGGFAVFSLVTAILLGLLWKGRLRPHLFAVLIAALVALDLSTRLSSDLRPKQDAGTRETTWAPAFWKKPPEVEFLLEKRKTEYFRVDDPSGLYPGNYGDAWRLDSTMGHGATGLVDYFAFRGVGWGPGSNATALLNVRYIPSAIPIGWLPKALDGERAVYYNPRAVPRAFAASRFRTFDEAGEMLRWIQAPLMEPAETVLLYRRDVDALRRSLPDWTGEEEAELDLEMVSRVTAFDRRAMDIPSEEERHREYVFQPPWGWSPGDEVTVRIGAKDDVDALFLVANYFPDGAEPSPVRLLLRHGESERELTAVLEGRPDPEPDAPSRRAVVNLGPLARGEHSLTLQRCEACRARIDSIRLTTRAPLAAPGRVAILSHEPQRIVLDAELDRASFVVLSEVHYPGWQAFVDGERVPVLPANVILRAVPVPAGKHAVELVFRPSMFRWGLGCALASFGMVGLLWLRGRSRGRSRDDARSRA